VQDVKDIAADVEALSVIYSHACERYMRMQFRSGMRPEHHGLYREMQDSYIAWEYTWRELLAATNRLRDAGAPEVADAMLRSATSNASVAESEALRKELGAMKGAA
jgi:hypothetical protein